MRFLRDPSADVRSQASDSIQMIQSFPDFRYVANLPEVRAAVTANASDETGRLSLRGTSATILVRFRDLAVVPLINS